MNNYDYYRTHKSEIDAAIMGLSMPQDGSALGGLLVIVAMVVALYVGVVAIALPPVTQKILLKCYNRADNTPNRSTKGMMQALPPCAGYTRCASSLQGLSHCWQPAPQRFYTCLWHRTLSATS